MRRMLSWSAAAAAPLVAVSLTAAPAAAQPVQDSLPGGTSISVSIETPADETVVPPGPVTITGSASVGKDPNPKGKSTLNALRLRVNGGDPEPVFTTPSIPLPGPVKVDYTVDTDPLGPGQHELCVTAEGGDSVGVGDVTACHTVTVSGGGEAFAVSAAGPVHITQTPHATCPPGETLTLAGIDVGILTVDALLAECVSDPATGETTASAGVDQASLLGGAITISNIESTCVADADGLHGSSSVGTINGNPIGTSPGSLTIPLVAQVHFNETSSGPDGEVEQNAIRVETLLGQQIILGACRIG